MALSNTSDHSDQFGRYATIYGVAMILSTQNDASCRNDRPVSDARAVKYSRFGSDPTIVPDPNSFVCQSLFPDRSSGIRKNMILRMHADKIPDQHVVSDRDTAYATVKAVRAKSRTIAYAQTLSGDHIYGKSITDPCLGWEDSRDLIYTIADMCR